MRHRHSARHWALKITAFLVIGTAAAIVFTFLTMNLWNWLMPDLFGLKLLSFWQTLGLLALTWLFFGRFRGLSHGHHWRHRMKERWMRMSPEEREKFRQHMHERWHHHHHHDEPPAEGNVG